MPAVQKFGIDNLKTLIKFSFSLTKELSEDFADGKLSFGEQLGLVNDVIGIVGIAKAWPAIKNELSELSAAEKKQLREYVVSEFNVTTVSGNKLVDAQIKNSLAFAVSGLALVEGWKAIKGE